MCQRVHTGESYTSFILVIYMQWAFNHKNLFFYFFSKISKVPTHLTSILNDFSSPNSTGGIQLECYVLWHANDTIYTCSVYNSKIVYSCVAVLLLPLIWTIPV